MKEASNSYGDDNTIATTATLT